MPEHLHFLTSCSFSTDIQTLLRPVVTHGSGHGQSRPISQSTILSPSATQTHWTVDERAGRLTEMVDEQQDRHRITPAERQLTSRKMDTDTDQRQTVDEKQDRHCSTPAERQWASRKMDTDTDQRHWVSRKTDIVAHLLRDSELAGRWTLTQTRDTEWAGRRTL